MKNKRQIVKAVGTPKWSYSINMANDVDHNIHMYIFYFTFNVSDAMPFPTSILTSTMECVEAV